MEHEKHHKPQQQLQLGAGYTHLSLGERFLGVLQNSLKARMENLHMQDWSRSVGMVLGLSICLE